jgi:hypothetical protein
MRAVMSSFVLLLAMLIVPATLIPSVRAGEDAPTFVDWLKAEGVDASFASREKLFLERFPSETYFGSAAQNLALWKALKTEAAAGRFPAARGTGSLPAPARRTGRTATVATHESASGAEWRVRVDPTGQVIAIDAPKATRYDGSPGEAEAGISATLPITSGFVSAAMLMQKAKAFDDGIYAAVEYAAEDGAGTFGGKRAMLAALRERLKNVEGAEAGPAAATLFAAARVASETVEVPAALTRMVEGQVRAFEASPDASKPIGFYTWSDELRTIFRQDRVLQAPLPPGPHRDALVRAIRDDAKARATYTAYAGLVERLTNPFVRHDLRGDLAALDQSAATSSDDLAFLPACRSNETTMANALLAAGVDSRTLDVMETFIKAVRDGKVSLAVKADSGWYDRTQWALEPLLLPEKTAEAPRLQFSDEYRHRLEELFRGALALARETHAKALDIAITAAPVAPKVHVSPSLSVEPLATAWLRRADTYRYVRTLIEATFGRAGLATMRRRTPDGAVDAPLDSELRFIESLFVGAYVRSCREIGHPVGAVPDADAADALFSAWAKEPAKDPDLSRDLRMMVPVMVDPLRGRTKVWTFLGWSSQNLTFTFVNRPTVTVVSTKDGRTAPDAEVVFDGGEGAAAYPVFAEAWTSTLMNRDEFRRLCDEKKTKAAIVAEIEK